MAESEARASRYRSAGVDIDAGNALARAIGPLVRATARPGAEGGIGGFGAVFDLARTGLRDPLLVATTDGVGTKLRLLTEAGRLHTAGVDLVAMCVNDLICQGAEPLFFLDYYATGGLDRRSALATLQGVADGCREAGCALIGGETAEMPGHYAPGDIDLAGFAVGAVERDGLLPRTDVVAGDVILGLPASGLHANGFSLVRLVLHEAGLGIEDRAPFLSGATLADALLAPTRIYVRAALRAIAQGGVKAVAHVTGGGLVENLPRVLPEGVRARLDARTWPLLPVFSWLAETGSIDRAEMASTFNLGIGLVLVVAEDSADAVVAALGEPVFTIGRIEAGAGAPVVRLDHLETAWAGAASPS